MLAELYALESARDVEMDLRTLLFIRGNSGKYITPGEIAQEAGRLLGFLRGDRPISRS